MAKVSQGFLVTKASRVNSWPEGEMDLGSNVLFSATLYTETEATNELTIVLIVMIPPNIY